MPAAHIPLSDAKILRYHYPQVLSLCGAARLTLTRTQPPHPRHTPSPPPARQVLSLYGAARLPSTSWLLDKAAPANFKGEGEGWGRVADQWETAWCLKADGAAPV